MQLDEFPANSRVDAILAQKDAIVEKIRQYCQETPQEERDFGIEVIEACSADLDEFIDNLSSLSAYPNNQEDMAQQIRQLCEKLSTFGDPEEAEYPEYNFGLLYSVFFEELAGFIVGTADRFGFRSPRIIDMHAVYFYLESDCWSPFRVCVGQSDQESVALEYSVRDHCFYIDETPFYDPTLMPIFKMQIDRDGSELSFEALLEGECRRYVFSACDEAGKTWLKTIYDLHVQRLDLGERQPGFADIVLETHRGIIRRIKTRNYDEAGDIIPMFDEGAGARVFVAKVTKEGKTIGFSEESNGAEIVDERAFVVHAVPEWKRFDVRSIRFQGDELVVATGDSVTFHDEQRNDVIAPCLPQLFRYQIRTYVPLLKFIQEVIALRVGHPSEYRIP